MGSAFFDFLSKVLLSGAQNYNNHSHCELLEQVIKDTNMLLYSNCIKRRFVKSLT